MTEPEAIPLTAQVACVLQEIAMRRQVYPRRIRSNAITQGDADKEIATMIAVYETLRRLVDKECAQQSLFPARKERYS